MGKMIYSKKNLQVVEVTGKDKAIPVLDNVCFEPNGTTIACNGRTLLCILPVPNDRLKNSVLYEKDDPILDQPLSLSSDIVKDLIKNIPNDVTFDHLLEMVKIEQKGKTTFVVMNDGKNEKKIRVKPYPNDYVDYKKIFQRIYKQPIEKTLYLDRKRLELVLKTIGKFSSDAPIAMHINKENDLIIRGNDPTTGQNYLGVVTGVQGKIPEFRSDELEILKGTNNVKKEITKKVITKKKGIIKKKATIKKKISKKGTLKRKKD